jgi:hypothetical protein
MYALTGILILGTAMLPLARALFPSPTDEELRRVTPPPMSARAVVRMNVVQPAVNDYEGSVAQSVARGAGRTGKAVYGALKGAARHARVVWDRPSAYVRRHAASGRRYYETLSSRAVRNFLGDVPQRVGRHSYEFQMSRVAEALLAS